VLVRTFDAHSTRRKDGKQVAIKIIDLEESKDDVQTICREITTLVSSSCPQLINYYGSAVFGTKLVRKWRGVKRYAAVCVRCVNTCAAGLDWRFAQSAPSPFRLCLCLSFSSFPAVDRNGVR